MNLILVNLKSILNSAVVDGILERSPAVGIKPMKDKEEPASKTYHRALTEEEQGQFMKYAKDGHERAGSPKSRAGTRDIPINDSIKQVLKSQKEKQRLFYGNVISLSQYVFTGQNCTRVYNSTANTAVRRVLEKMRVEGIKVEYFTVHALRDTFATRYIEQGGSPQVLKTLLGHSSLSMTMDLYSHVMPNTKQEEMDSIKIVF